MESTSIKIANICLTAVNDTQWSLPHLKPDYRAFLCNLTDCQSSDVSNLPVNLSVGDLPITSDQKNIFKSELSWEMFSDKDHFLISNHPPAFERPFWIAKVDHAFTCASLFISESFVQSSNGQAFIEHPIGYPLDQILLMYILSLNEGAIIHSAGIVSNGKGYLFPGRSGAGKSTIAEQFINKKGVTLISDDRMVARKTNGRFRAFGTPWPGEAGVALNESMPLSSIFFLNHGIENHITPIEPNQALEMLMPVTSIPWYDRDVFPRIMDFCEDLVLHVPAYVLDFKPSVEVTHVLDQFFSD